MRPTIEQPKVFISYAWGSIEYQNRVLSLAADLQSDGIDVLLDKWSLKEGNDTYAYMEQCVTNDTVTNVLILLDPIYAEKANNRVGGVGTETQIISPEIYNHVTQEKFLPIVMERNQDNTVPKPSFLKGMLHFDLSKVEDYDTEYKRLVKRLYGVEIIPKPALGKMPQWVTEESSISSVARTAIDSLRRSISGMEKRSGYITLLSSLRDRISEFSSSSGSYLVKYSEIKPLRDEFLHLLNGAVLVENSSVLIGDFLQELYCELESYEICEKDLKQLLLHEMFIYTIAYFIKNKNYVAVEYFLNRTFFESNCRNSQQRIGFHIFYHYSSKMDHAVKSRDNKNYHSGTAQYWMENVALEFCNKNDIILADVLLCNYSIYGKSRCGDEIWFPVTYVYGGEFNAPFNKLVSSFKSSEVASRWARIFDYQNLIEFQQSIIKLSGRGNNQKGRLRYNGSFTGAQLIEDYIVAEEIGMYP